MSSRKPRPAKRHQPRSLDRPKSTSRDKVLTHKPGPRLDSVKLEGRPAGLSGHSQGYWLFGAHSVGAALTNPRRSFQRLVQIGDSGEGLTRGCKLDSKPLPPWETVEREVLERIVGREAVHQGVAARVAPLPETDIFELCDLGRNLDQAVILVLDQITDPHNVGAILRSASAFGALGVVLTERHAAPESGILAKSASGALEHMPLARVINLSRAMEELKSAGFWCVGLAAEAKKTLAEVKLSGRVALCLGAEGTGLRRLTREHCDLLVRLPTQGPIDQLNVSNAVSVALYELRRR